MKDSSFLRETVDLVRQIETRFLELGARLFRIREKELWKGTYDSYQEFLDVARISPGNASILASIHRHYVVEGNISPEKLAGIGYSNLYEAIPLIEREGVKAAVTKAETLTRSEIKDEVRDVKHGSHDHSVGTERWGVCEKCGKFVKI
jgi:hypothetical protein